MRTLKLKLRSKIMLSLGSIFFVLLGTSTFFQISELRKVYLDEISIRSTAWATDIVNDLMSLHETSDNIDWMLRIQSVRCIQLLQANQGKGIKHFAVLDKSGSYVAHSESAARNSKLEGTGLRKAMSEFKQNTVLNGNYYHTLIPVFGRGQAYLGTIDVAVSRDIIDERVKKLLLYSLAFFCLFLVVGFYLISLLIHVLFLKPIGELTASASSMADGDLDHPINTERWDEIGELGKSFADMRDSIKKQISALHNENEERKKAESEVRRLNKGLEQRVEERTNALVIANEDLKQSTEKAESANLAKSQFLASMSHELRTPLNAIIGFSDILRHDTSLEQNTKHHVNIINKSGDHLLALINDILDMAKVEAGRMNLEKDHIDLHGFLDNLLSMLNYHAQSKDLDLRSALSENLPVYIQTDALKLRQILLNLLSNAIKFTDSGSILINANYQPLDNKENSGILIFDIEDTGHGIDADEMDDLFKPFTQTESGRKSQEGTGLGLSLCKKFIGLMDGEISVESTLNKGTSFHICLPVIELGYADAQSTDKNVLKLAPEQPSYSILIVDDVEYNRALLISLLERVGFRYSIAENGQEAINQFTNQTPDLILMDILMPVMDGKIATQKIRQLPGGAVIPIIAVTASVFEGEKEDILNAGCDEVLFKPFREAHLFALIKEQLEVKYIYGVSTEAYLQELVASPLSLKLLKGLPPQWLKQLQQAGVEGDIGSLQSLIVELTEEHQELRRQLQERIDVFEFESIANIKTDNDNHG